MALLLYRRKRFQRLFFYFVNLLPMLRLDRATAYPGGNISTDQLISIVKDGARAIESKGYHRGLATQCGNQGGWRLS